MFPLNCAVVLLLFSGSCLTLNSNYRCGTKSRPVGLIVNGTTVVKNQWPWLVSLVHLPSNKHFCGGSIVSENHILTAAHCIHDKRSPTKLHAYELVVLLGKHDLSIIYEKGSSTFYPTTVIVHPDWNPNSEKYDADLAILFSEVPMQFSLSISPVCLASDSSIESIVLGVVSGWGASRLTGVPVAEKVPREAQVKSIALTECIEENPTLDAFSTFRMFCAHGVVANSGPCSGDSGGGFYVKQKNVWFVRGIISSSQFDNGSCDVTKKTLYTKLSSFLKWINNQMASVLIDDTFATLSCSFSSQYFALDLRDGNIQTCKAENLVVSQPAVNLIMDNSDNSAVKYFHVMRQRTPYFPNNVGNLFPNLVYVLSEKCELKYIEKRNFENMEYVTDMSLAHNYLESIPEDAFDHLGNLRAIHLHFNSLKSLGTNILSKNYNLRHFYGYRNQIEILQDGLFSKNRKIVGIHVDSNRLRIIKLSFDLERKYERINFRDNDCFDQVFPDNLQMNQLIESLKVNC